jgi:cell division protein FtsB
MLIHKEMTKEQAHRLLYEPLPAEQSRLDVEARFNTDHDTTAFDNLMKDSYEHVAAAPTPQPQVVASPFGNLKTPSPQFDSYVTPQNPISTTFRPKIYDQNLVEVDTSIPVAPPQLVAEVDIEPFIAPQPPAMAYDDDEEVEGKIRLNTKGIIAVVAFFAVVALVAILIIMSAVSINASGTRIQELTADNAVASARLEELQREHNRVRRQRTTRNDEDYNVYDYIEDHGLVQLPEARPLPQLSIPNLNQNPDHSTNWFDQIVRFLSGLFR